MISFDNVTIEDNYNDVAIANGTFLHKWFKNWNFDISLDANKFLFLNTTTADNNLYNGKVFASGLASIGHDSYTDKTTLDINIKTEKGTIFNIPMNDNVDVEENNFVEFVNKDTNQFTINQKKNVDLTDIEMNFDLEINENARVKLIFDDQIGDVMQSTGNGNLRLNINTLGDFKIFGNYKIKDGDYLFTLQNVINKRFDLDEGGVISWNGDPYTATINLTATYRLRARLYDLLASIDSSAIYKKRIPVDLNLTMKNALLNPDISFDIDLPTADEATRSKVKSILYVSSEEENIQELNKQVFSLLVLNRFLPPPNQKSAYASANVGATTSSELISNQLSNWLSKISNNFDIGVNYHPGDQLSNQELELALSTQIFNDRLTIDSNFGFSKKDNISNQAQNSNNLIGDVTIEYKISKSGKFRVKAFNVSNQYSFDQINSPYTQGLGLFYKEEYDSWGELYKNFRNMLQKKK